MLARRPFLSLLAVVMLVVTGACSTGAGSDPTAQAGNGSSAGQPAGSETGAEAPEPQPARVLLNVPRRGVAVDSVVRVRAEGGELDSVRVTSPAGRLAGSSTAGTWVASGRLEPGTTYQVKVVSTSTDGVRATVRKQFRTVTLSDDQQAFASIAPLDGETVGVGMPVVVFFDVPVSDRAAMERHMSVTSKPAHAGSWHWMSSTEVHWRPQRYWRAGTTVSVDLDINSVAVGGGIYGQEDRHIDFQVGTANIYRVDAAAHQMTVFSGGELIRTLPVTTGKPGFTTRSGVKVIMEKEASRRMNSETIGIDPDSPDGYVIDGVQWTMRLTYSGEFIHAAPWSVGSQGVANVSHGCTGMSTENAKWLYDMSKRGDVVEYVGTDRPMELTNGFGDWNLPFPEYAQGSAL